MKFGDTAHGQKISSSPPTDEVNIGEHFGFVYRKLIRLYLIQYS